MSHNKYKYRFCLASEQTQREAVGYTGGNISTNGILVVGYKEDQDMTIGTLTIPTKPNYMGSLPDWPFASHAETLSAIRKGASTKGASDGYMFTKVVV